MALKDKETSELRAEEKMNIERKEKLRQIQELTEKMNTAFEDQKSKEREKIANESEFDKQKALYLQQIEHLTQKTAA